MGKSEENLDLSHIYLSVPKTLPRLKTQYACLLYTQPMHTESYDQFLFVFLVNLVGFELILNIKFCLQKLLIF